MNSKMPGIVIEATFDERVLAALETLTGTIERRIRFDHAIAEIQ